MRIFITGIASGIGRAAAEKFISEGHEVYGIDVREGAPENAISFIADVTDTDAVARVSEELRQRDITLDVIINAAGVHGMYSLVEGDYAKMRRLVEINLLGAMQVNRALHPLLAKGGRIVIVTSEVAPLDPMPFNGLYSVSKCALDCYAQALRQELNLIGQSVVTVRPGAIETPLARGALSATENLADGTALYEGQAHHFLSLTKKFMGTPISPEKLALLIYRAATVKKPRLVYSKNRNLGLILLSILPKRLQCAVIKLLLNRAK